jgi:hypothetical protein
VSCVVLGKGVYLGTLGVFYHVFTHEFHVEEVQKLNWCFTNKNIDINTLCMRLMGAMLETTMI